MIYLNDSNRIWHVAKTGSDSNGGHAQQYPVNLAADAKLTIGAAVSAAAAGDTIIIWPGDYAENVDAGGKALTFIGAHRNKSKIAVTSGDALVIANDSVIKNLALDSSAWNGQGLDCTSKTNIVIDDCDISGHQDGALFNNAQHIFLRNSRFRSDYDGCNMTGAVGIAAENCIFQTLGTYGTGSDVRAVLGVGQSVFLNCVFLAERNDISSKAIWAVYLVNNARAVFSNCTFEVTAGSNHTGTVGGVYVAGSDAAACLKNCSVHSSSSGSPSAGPYDLWQSAGRIVVSSSSYETMQGTIIQSGVGWSDGIKGELTALGLDKAAKMLINKAVQDKLTGAIEYYDDDGQTVVLTHTPEENGASITRMPG